MKRVFRGIGCVECVEHNRGVMASGASRWSRDRLAFGALLLVGTTVTAAGCAAEVDDSAVNVDGLWNEQACIGATTEVYLAESRYFPTHRPWQPSDEEVSLVPASAAGGVDSTERYVLPAGTRVQVFFRGDGWVRISRDALHYVREADLDVDHQLPCESEPLELEQSGEIARGLPMEATTDSGVELLVLSGAPVGETRPDQPPVLVHALRAFDGADGRRRGVAEISNFDAAMPGRRALITLSALAITGWHLQDCPADVSLRDRWTALSAADQYRVSGRSDRFTAAEAIAIESGPDGLIFPEVYWAYQDGRLLPNPEYVPQRDALIDLGTHPMRILQKAFRGPPGTPAPTIGQASIDVFATNRWIAEASDTQILAQVAAIIDDEWRGLDDYIALRESDPSTTDRRTALNLTRRDREELYCFATRSLGLGVGD